MRYPRTIALRRVPHGTLLIAAIHLVAAISFVHLYAQRPLWTVGGLALLLASLLVVLQGARRAGVAVIELGDDGLLRFPGRPEVEGQPCGRMADFGVLLWLEWRESPSGRRRALMLWRAACADEDWRALGLWLRHKTRPPQGLSDAG